MYYLIAYLITFPFAWVLFLNLTHRYSVDNRNILSELDPLLIHFGFVLIWPIILFLNTLNVKGTSMKSVIDFFTFNKKIKNDK